MKLTAKQILLQAAEMVKQRTRGCEYACIALYSAAFDACDTAEERNENAAAHEAALDKFAEMYKPTFVGKYDSWFGDYRDDANQQRRYEALIATATAFE